MGYGKNHCYWSMFCLCVFALLSCQIWKFLLERKISDSFKIQANLRYQTIFSLFFSKVTHLHTILQVLVRWVFIVSLICHISVLWVSRKCINFSRIFCVECIVMLILCLSWWLFNSSYIFFPGIVDFGERLEELSNGVEVIFLFSFYLDFYLLFFIFIFVFFFHFLFFFLSFSFPFLATFIFALIFTF